MTITKIVKYNNISNSKKNSVVETFGVLIRAELDCRFFKKESMECTLEQMECSFFYKQMDCTMGSHYHHLRPN